jgi:hypothetical protein
MSHLFSAAHFPGHCFRLIPASGSFAASACEPESVDSTLLGEVSLNESEHALAFVISYERIQEFAGRGRPLRVRERVVYVYRQGTRVLPACASYANHHLARIPHAGYISEG